MDDERATAGRLSDRCDHASPRQPMPGDLRPPGPLGGLQLGLAATGVALSLWAAAHLSVFYTIPALVAGIGVGNLAGAHTGRALSRQFADTGRLVLYSEDTPLYAALLPLAALAMSPAVFLTMAYSIWTTPALRTLVPLALCFMNMAWLSHDLALARNLWLLRERVGDVPIQWFHARSLVGPEGTIGQRGVVIVECAPDGYIRLQGERWRARSRDGLTLAVGRPVEVQHIIGLTLVVTAAMEPRDGR